MKATLARAFPWAAASFPALIILVAAGIGKNPRTPDELIREYDAQVPKTVLELQPFRQSTSIRIGPGGGQEVTLVNLNPNINAWYLLSVRSPAGAPEVFYHLENPRPRERRLVLDEKFPVGLVIIEGGTQSVCELFGSGNVLEQARNSRLPFYPLCKDRLLLRNSTVGHRTSLEATAEFLRDHVWGGEAVLSMGHFILSDRYHETGSMQTVAPDSAGGGARPGDLPLPALIDPRYAAQGLTSGNLGITLETVPRGGMTPGAWYAAAGNPGVYVSLIQPNLIAAEILQSHKTLVNALDGGEASALCYLVSFDLDQFDLGYALGTDHPRTSWSERILAQEKDPKLPGPDGIGSVTPLVSTGLLSPAKAPKTVAVFTAGFKRAHGAFRYGDLAQVNHGSHYGFIENGLVFSKLQPGLATIFVLDDRVTGMKTWDVADNALLPRISYARQNGVPLVEFDPASQATAPGRLVNRWGPGNWSGSEEIRLRTMRSGAALQQRNGKRFLIYAVFSDATPSAMARVFQAYQCQYAMLLDMNALEHTYMALYRRSGKQVVVDHLIRGMSQVDKSAAGELLPRFLMTPDNRDFFYLTSRSAREVKP
jgi:hypothetical protein